MRLALLHRRLVALMGLAALTAFGAGHGLTTPEVLVTAAALTLALVWRAPQEWNRWMEHGIRLAALLLLAWILYIAFALVGDFLVPVLLLLLLLLASELLRPLEARNDLRLYSLAFGLLIAATAYFPGPLFAVGFVAFIALATLALMVGHLRRQAERFRIAEIRIGRSFLAATAALSAVTVLMSAALFAVFPRLQRNWLGPARGAAQQAMVGFGDGVSLGEYGSRISPNPAVVFRVEFPSRRPPESWASHWRGRSYDHFDGVRWTRTPGLTRASLPPQLYRERWGGALQSYEIYGGPPGARVLFGLHPIYGIAPRTAIRAGSDGVGDVMYFGGEAPVYRVTSVASRPAASELRAVPERDAPALRPYLQLPLLEPRVAQLADSLTRGQPTRYDRARAVEHYLRSEFGYTLELPASRRETSLEHFLFARRTGHCEYFSTAMAVLLRSVGIPARNVTGFLGGEWNEPGGYLAVTQNDAHSWVEVWFPELGWVPFDPTPAASRERVAGAAAIGWHWPLRFWLDGVEHRWYKWVLYYDLDKQLRLFRDVSAAFASAPQHAPRSERGTRTLPPLTWTAATLGILTLLWLAHTRRRAELSAEARLYLALRRVYARSGFVRPDGAGTPLAFLAALRQAGAPAHAAAERLVTLYLRARFAGEEIGTEGRAEMQATLAEVRRALRRARRGRRRERG